MVVDRVAGVLEALQPELKAGQAKHLRAELVTVERELKHLAEAVAKGGVLSALVDAIQERQTKRDELSKAIAALEAPTTLDAPAIERKVRGKLGELARTAHHACSGRSSATS